jgi:hypothetical protein
MLAAYPKLSLASGRLFHGASVWNGLRPISVGVKNIIFYLEGCNDGRVKHSSNGTEGGRNFFRCRQIPFNTGA